VKKWRLKKGDRVKKGQVIVELKDEVIKATLDAAEAQYKMADLNYKMQLQVYKEAGISELQMKTFQVPAGRRESERRPHARTLGTDADQGAVRRARRCDVSE